MRRALLTAGKANPLAGVNIGDSFMGGYYAGIIDTTQGNIIAADQSQTGLRYALIVAGKSLETTTKAWKNANTAGPTGVQTRWDGLGATNAMVAAGSSTVYPAAWYCAGLSYPSDGASAWYLPALDELELAYRGLKPDTTNNTTGLEAGPVFPGNQVYGYNPSSSPTGAAYTTSVPGRTSVPAFQSAGAQALTTSSDYYLCATEYAATYAWIQFTLVNPGYQTNQNKATNTPLRPFRRLVLT